MHNAGPLIRKTSVNSKTSSALKESFGTCSKHIYSFNNFFLSIYLESEWMELSPTHKAVWREQSVRTLSGQL